MLAVRPRHDPGERFVRLVARQGVALEWPSNEVDPADPRLFECPLYARIVAVFVLVVVQTSTIHEEQKEVANGYNVGRGLR